MKIENKMWVNWWAKPECVLVDKNCQFFLFDIVVIELHIDEWPHNYVYICDVCVLCIRNFVHIFMWSLLLTMPFWINQKKRCSDGVIPRQAKTFSHFVFFSSLNDCCDCGFIKSTSSIDLPIFRVQNFTSNDHKVEEKYRKKINKNFSLARSLLSLSLWLLLYTLTRSLFITASSIGITHFALLTKWLNRIKNILTLNQCCWGEEKKEIFLQDSVSTSYIK